jgi:hypothetical protein
MRNLAALATSEGRDKLAIELLGKYPQVRPQVLKTVKDAKRLEVLSRISQESCEDTAC